MSIVSPREERSRVSGVSRAKNGWSMRYGATTESGSPCSWMTQSTIARSRSPTVASARNMSQLLNMPHALSKLRCLQAKMRAIAASPLPMIA